MTNSLLAALMLAVPAVVPAQAATTSDSGDDRRVEAEIRRLNTQEVQAFMRADPDGLDSLWSDDLVVTNPLNRFVRKADVLRLVTSGTLAFASYDRRVEYVHRYGDVVVVAGSETVVWAGKMPLAGKTSLLRFTAIWAKQGGRWQEVARHANIVPQT